MEDYCYTRNGIIDKLPVIATLRHRFRCFRRLRRKKERIKTCGAGKWMTRLQANAVSQHSIARV